MWDIGPYALAISFIYTCMAAVLQKGGTQPVL